MSEPNTLPATFVEHIAMHPVTLEFRIDEHGNYVTRKVELPFAPFEGLVIQFLRSSECTILDEMMVTEVTWCMETGEVTLQVEVSFGEPWFEITKELMVEHGWSA